MVYTLRQGWGYNLTLDVAERMGELAVRAKADDLNAGGTCLPVGRLCCEWLSLYGLGSSALKAAHPTNETLLLLLECKESQLEMHSTWLESVWVVEVESPSNRLQQREN